MKLIIKAHKGKFRIWNVTHGGWHKVLGKPVDYPSRYKAQFYVNLYHKNNPDTGSQTPPSA